MRPSITGLRYPLYPCSPLHRATVVVQYGSTVFRSVLRRRQMKRTSTVLASVVLVADWSCRLLEIVVDVGAGGLEDPLPVPANTQKTTGPDAISANGIRMNPGRCRWGPAMVVTGRRCGTRAGR